MVCYYEGEMKSIREADVAGRKVLLRADLDGPVDSGLDETLPTIRFLVKNGARTIIIGHLDRPGGKVVERLRLDSVARWFVETGHAPSLRKMDDCIGSEVEKAVEKMADGDILLLENLRFHKGEVKPKVGTVPTFARQLADLGEVYVNDCFAASHRRHASIVGVPQLLPSYAGLRLVEEVAVLGEIVETGHAPSLHTGEGLVFIVGGAKSKTKAPLVKKLAKIADKILLGGTLMFEKSLEGIPNVIFPIDAVRAEDIGPKTIEMFKKEIKKAKTIVWNGPLGVVNSEEFEVGTREIAKALAESEAYTVVGGGDTVAALVRFNLRDKIDFVSTGGGAMLQFLAEGTLPGIEALS